MRFIRVCLTLVAICIIAPNALPAQRSGNVSTSSASKAADAKPKPRARDLVIPFDGTPGPLNSITDVAGVTVGHTTLISGEGKLQVGKGPIRTGVTAILPRGKDSMNDAVFAGWFSQNGNGEMT